MSHSSKLIVTAVLLVLLGGLGAADMYLSGDPLGANVPLPPDAYVPLEVPGESTSSATALEEQPQGGVMKRQGVNVETALPARGFAVQPANERSMLEQIVNTDVSQVNARSILQDGDRIGAVVWIEGPDVKEQFLALKDALLAAFSPQVQDLADQTIAEPGTPVRNEVTFLDPALSEERLTIIRVGERLYELHTVVGKEEQKQTIIDALSAL